MTNYPQELAQDAVCQSHTGHMSGLWFLPARPLRLNTNDDDLTLPLLKPKCSLPFSQDPASGLCPAYTFIYYSFQNDVLS